MQRPTPYWSLILVLFASLFFAQCKKRIDSGLESTGADGCPSGFAKMTDKPDWDPSVLGNNMPVGALPGIVISLSVTMSGLTPVYDHKVELDKLKSEIQNQFFSSASTIKNDPTEKLFFTAMIIEAKRISSFFRGTALKTQAEREAAAGAAAVPANKKSRLDQETLENYFGVINDSAMTLHQQLNLRDADVKILTKDLCLSKSFDVTKQIPQIIETLKSVL